MNYNYKYRLDPPTAIAAELQRHVDICRQLYNHCLYTLNKSDNIPSRYTVQDTLPDLKQWWTALKDVHSKVLQMVVKRVYDNISTVKRQKDTGRNVGKLKWKAPTEYRSLTYNQSGFEFKNTNGQSVLWLSKLGDIPIHPHRSLPDSSAIKQVTVKREPCGDWFATLGIETDDSEVPEKPVLNTIDRDAMVGIDVGIINYVYDTDGVAVESLDLSDEFDRLEREQRNLSRKQHGSNNWAKQRTTVARIYQDIKNKRRDFLHKLSNYYAREYDLVAVDDLNITEMMQFPSNSRNRASAAWGKFLDMLEYKCDREGTHFIRVNPHGTTKECASCGDSTKKPLWVREHSCPVCGFGCNRDANAGYNILSRGVDDLGVVHSEVTPVETVPAVDTTMVSARHVIETGSPCLNETAQAVK